MLIVLNQSRPIPGVSDVSEQIRKNNPDPSLQNNFRARIVKINTSLSVESAWLEKRGLDAASKMHAVTLSSVAICH